MKKVLVISFDCFNLSSSNGRSLGSLLKTLQGELSISQIYIKDGQPNFISGKYCCINESKLIHNFFNSKKVIKTFEYNEKCNNGETEPIIHNLSKTKKTPLTMMIRNIVWSLFSCRLSSVYKWADKINPDYILIQAGDLPFLFHLALKIAKRNNSRVIFYTTENYPFKEVNYTNLNKKSTLYPLLKQKLFKATKKVVLKSESLLFLTESLLEEFKEHFKYNGNSYVIYPCSQINAPLTCDKHSAGNQVFSYCGNLGLKRYKTLIEISKLLEKFLPNSKLIICGRTTEEIKNELLAHRNIEFLGTVSYAQVCEIYKQSDYLLHVESFDEKIAQDSRHAFSGKIADCISSCKPFIFVGPSIMFETQFLKNNSAALVFTSIDQLQNALESNLFNNIVFDVKHQMEIANKYFSPFEANRVLCEVFDL